MAESDGRVGKGVRSPCGPRSALVTTLVALAEPGRKVKRAVLEPFVLAGT
jgi:hypothetical protein